jgi:hypothetical protein
MIAAKCMISAKGDDPARRRAYRCRDRGHAGLTLADALRPAAAPHGRQRRRRESRTLQAAVQPIRLLPGEQHLRSRPGLHGQGHTDRDGVAQSHRPLGCGHAHPLVALPPVELRRLAGVVTQRCEHRSGGRQEPVLSGRRRQLREARAEDEAPLQIAGDQPVVLQGDREPVRGGTGETGGGHELGQRGRPGLQRAEYDRSLVEHADPA